MNFDEDENEKKHHILLENFLLKGNLNAFKKMLNIEPNKISKNTFLTTSKTKQIRLFKIVRHHNKTELNDNFSINNNESYNYNNSGNILLERHLDYADQKYKNKCMKGNYETYSKKFNLMKMNLAKRKGISLDNLQIPKNETFINQIYERQLNGNDIIKNKEILNAMTIEEIIQNKKRDYINKYNLELDNLQLPKIISKYKFRRIKIKPLK